MKTRFKTGFTLIELLIASAIFAVIMVMATAVFSLTSSYNTKISETRNVISAARGAATQISDDVRLSNGEATITIRGVNANVKDIFLVYTDPDGNFLGAGPGGAYVYAGSGTSTLPTAGFNYDLPGSPTDAATKHFSLGVIQRTQGDHGQIIVYRPIYSDSNYSLRRSVQPINRDEDWAAPIVLDVSRNLTIYNSTSLDARFRGFTRKTNTNRQQPFIYFGILAKTLNYGSISPRVRSQIEIKSLVESRDYN